MRNTVEKAENINSLADWTDEELLLEYQMISREDCFSELVGRYEKELLNYLTRFLGKRDVAEDVMQATFLQVHLKCRDFEQGRKVRPWLYTIATNKAIDQQRRDKRHRMQSLDRSVQSDIEGDPNHSSGMKHVLLSNDALPDEIAMEHERDAMVRSTVEALREIDRTVIQLVVLKGMKYREAAEELHIPTGTVKSRLFVATKALREAFKDKADAA